jgi:hypothetical protein
MLEGLTLDSWWDWKDTLGPLKDRVGFQGVWGYQQTHGLGMMEYLEWAEDMDLHIGEFCTQRSQVWQILMNHSHWRMGWSCTRWQLHCQGRPPAFY